jgi:uncharacterized membrane protein YjjP (DUF1212 family)
MEVCLLAGEIMLKYGGETYRVEETMERIAHAQQMEEVHSYVTPTGIVFSFRPPGGEEERTRLIRIDQRLIDLNKVSLVNDLSRRVVAGKLSLAEAEKELRLIDRQKMSYSLPFQYLAAGVASGSFAILFGGVWIDFFPAFLAGMAVYASFLYLEIWLKVKFFAELLAAFVGGLLAILLYRYMIGMHVDQIIIGALMPLVPGLPLTNAVRDIMAGDLIAGVGRTAEALLTALSIAAGVAIAISILM